MSQYSMQKWGWWPSCIEKLFRNISEYLLISDKEAFSKSHKAADECVHGLFTHWEEENSWVKSRHSQCRDIQATW